MELDDEGRTTVRVDNILDVDITIPRRTIIGSIEKVDLDKCKDIKFDPAKDPSEKGPMSK